MTPAATHDAASAQTLRQQAFGLEQKQRIFAAQFDALVRAHRAGLSDLARLAQSLLSASAVLGHLVLEVAPTRLMVGTLPVLEAGDEAGRWILPVFMSGVRSMQVVSAANQAQLIEFTRRVAELKVDGEAIQDFHDWLWADGAEGLQTELLPSFVESVETSGVAMLQTAARALRPNAAIDSEGHAVTIDSRELDTAAARAEFEVPLVAFAAAAAARDLELDGAEFRAARKAADDPAMWAEAEIDVVFSRPRMRLGVPAARMVRALLGRFQSQCDARLVRLFNRFLTQTDEFSHAIVEGLVRERLGTVIGAGLSAGEAGVAEPLIELFRGSPPALRSTLLSALLDRAPAEPPVQGLLRQVFAGLGLAPFLAALGSSSLSSLSVRQAVALVTLLQDAGVRTAALESLLAQLVPVIAAQALASLPLSTWTALSAMAARLVALGESEVTEPLLRRELSESGPRWSHLGPPLLKTGARGIPEAMVRPLATRLLGERQAGLVVQLALHRGVPEGHRLALLEVLASNQLLTLEVSRFRLAELLDPPTIRQRLRVMRRLSARIIPRTAGQR